MQTTAGMIGHNPRPPPCLAYTAAAGPTFLSDCLQGQHTAPGELVNVNTLDAFKRLDKRQLIQQVCVATSGFNVYFAFCTAYFTSTGVSCL
jgi:hypothetical protein